MIPYQKTNLGEHDFHKPACCEYCKMGAEFCPFIKNGYTIVKNIQRWTDIADRRSKSVLSGESEKKDGYTADFSSKIKKENEKGESNPASEGEKNNEQSQLEREIFNSHITCWGDGSGFEHDQMSRNLLGPRTTIEKIYDITDYEIQHEVLKQGKWNAWIDKFQYDYRFGRVSDMNAECILFPNVDNPWMFTEYVFKGIGGDSSKCAVSIPDEYIVEPPVYDENTLELVNGDISLSSPDSDFDGKYSDCDIYSRPKESGSLQNFHRFREIINWSDIVEWSLDELGGNQELYHKMNPNDIIGQECLNAGTRLYCAKIPVQSIKWGEHGNIPPHTIDMTAPKDWIEKSSSVSKVKAVYKSHVGSKFYSNRDGVISWKRPEENIPGVGMREGQAYVFPLEELSFTEGFSGGRKYYTYPAEKGAGIPLDMPQEMKNGSYYMMLPAEWIMGVSNSENLCHKGCALCKGSGTALHCSYLENISEANKDEINEMNGYFDCNFCTKENYGGKNPKCPHYIQNKKNHAIATYQKKFENTFQNNAASTVAGSTLDGAMGGFVSNGTYENIWDTVTNLGNRGDITVDYEISYEVVTEGNEKAKLNKEKYQGFGKGVQIVPGTGKYAIDSEQDANPFKGGDTNVYNDISTLSFNKFFSSVMHCATAKYCNEITGVSQNLEYAPGRLAGGDGKCRYYRDSIGDGSDGCPYNGIPKRAVEFGKSAIIVRDYLYSIASMYSSLTNYGAWEFEAGVEIKETAGLYKKEKIGEREWILSGSYAFCQEKENITLVAINSEGESSSVYSSSGFGGASLLADKNIPNGYLKCAKLRTSLVEKEIEIERKNENPESEEPYIKEIVKIRTYDVLEKFYWFHPLKNDGSGISANSESLPGLVQHVNSEGCWFCKSDERFSMPESNCTIIDNDEKFIGGWHPEYKDYSKIGQEFMQDVDAGFEREGKGVGDDVNTGDYTPIPSPKNKKGYWIDSTGVYILDERPTGVDGDIIANEQDRETNSGSHGTCLSFRKSNTEIDTSTGEKKSPKTTSGAVFSNDPYCLVFEQYREPDRDDSGNIIYDDHKKPVGRRPEFEDPEKGTPYYAACYFHGEQLMLPTMRHAIYCPKCDYYIPYKYHDIENCPWCGSKYIPITGEDGNKYWSERHSAEDKQWPSDASVIKKFFKIFGFGNVTVWAPPGTALKTDAYFWRHQSHITNGLKRQMLNRVGSGDFSGDFSSGSEMTLGYSESMGNFHPVPKEKKVMIGESSKIVPVNESMAVEERYGKKYIDWYPDSDPSLEAAYNDVMPRHLVPGLYEKSSDEGFEDEGVIAPYTKKSNDALKLVSDRQFKVLRNKIEPMYAYIMNPYTQEYPSMRASYDQRERQEQPIIYEGRRSVISPQVLACVSPNGDGRTYSDSYQTYYSGDLVYGNVREYFPSGFTWWYMNNVLGGRYTAHKEGHYHMDDAKRGPGRMDGVSGGEYTTGDRTVAKCALSIYGVLPLDKEIVAAYLIISPSGVDPSKNPIGRGWTNGPVMYCHYHALPKSHYKNGTEKHLHGSAGFPPDEYFDEDGKHHDLKPGTTVYSGENSEVISYEDESAYYYWGNESRRICDDRGKYYDDRFLDIMKEISSIYDDKFYRNVGTPKKKIYPFTEKSDNDTSVEGGLGFGYDSSSFPRPFGFIMQNLPDNDKKENYKFQYVVVNSDGNIVQKYPDSVIWKTETKKELEDEIKKHTGRFEFQASDGTIENKTSYVFTQVDSSLYGGLAPDNSQEIPGYFDMGWTNTRGYMYGDYEVDNNKVSVWNGPVIYQGDSPGGGNSSSNGSYTGGGEDDQSGMVSHVLPVTDIIKSLYNNRIERHFFCRAGVDMNVIKKWKFYSPVKGGTLDKLDEDIAAQNNQIFFGELENGAYLLTDTDSYPELNGDFNFIPTVSDDGDKYELSKKSVSIVVSFPSILIIDSRHNKSKIGTGDSSEDSVKEITLKNGRYTSYSEFESIMKQMFPVDGKDSKIDKLSGNQIRFTSKKRLNIYKIKDSVYPDKINISTGSYLPMQNRVISSTSGSAAGYEPSGLMSSVKSPWRFQIYRYSVQSFSVDLLRAPLCMGQKDWRYNESSADYSNAKCSNVNCQAHTMGCAVAANEKNKFFDKKSGVCPLCGTHLDPSQAMIMAGDGIMTYRYDTEFSPDPVISRIILRPATGIGLSSGYRVFVKGSESDFWELAISMSFDSVSGKYTQNFPDCNKAPINGPPTEFVYEFGEMKARFIKVEYDPVEQNVFHQYHIVESNGYQMVIEGNFSSFGAFSLQNVKSAVGGIEFEFPSYDSWENELGNISDDFSGECKYGDKIVIISSQYLGEDKNRMRISLNRVYHIPEGKDSYIKFFCAEYTGGIDEFSVYGYHYKTEESTNFEDVYRDSGYSTGIKDEKNGSVLKTGGIYLTMTDGYERHQAILTRSPESMYILPERPTQFKSVAVGIGDSANVFLTESENNSRLLWQVQKKKIITIENGKETEREIKVITGGNYYYDPIEGGIRIPFFDSEGTPMTKFEKSLENSDVFISYLPNSIFVVYWSGNGRSVTLKAKAAGHGPSYMLEKNSIRKIVDSSSFPDNGKTCKMVDGDGKIITNHDIPWICMNNKPSGLNIEEQSRSSSHFSKQKAGEFRNIPLTGKEIYDKMEDDQAFIDLYGSHCENCRGICTTEVTFTGAPNKIIHGTIEVMAEAYSKSGERTGGIDKGIFVCQCAPTDPAGGKMTKCFNIPTLLIYAKERIPDE